MSREVRMVPANWQHPKRSDGRYEPLLSGFSERVSEWWLEKSMWDLGYKRVIFDDWKEREGYECESFKDWHGPFPNPDDYMPEWPIEFCTHYQMYETTSEGTPISPVCETPEELAQWLVDNDASAFASMTASYDEWLSMIRAGSSVCSAVIDGGQMKSGVSAVKG